MRILLDLDCVLADFVGGYAAAWGFAGSDLVAEIEPGVYGLEAPVSRMLSKTGTNRLVTTDVFWGQIEGNAGFWSDLPKLPWCDELVAEVRAQTEDWHVVTSPGRCRSSYDGKATWLKRTFGDAFDRFAVTPHKYAFAGNRTLLVDDYGKNCDEFEAHGGTSILFPQKHNAAHAFADDPMRVVVPAIRTYGALRRPYRGPKPL